MRASRGDDQVAARLDDDPAADLEHVAELRRPGAHEFDAHERGVLAPLALVGFFTNYDTGLLTLASPAIADGLSVEVATFGIAVAVIRLGALASVGTLRLADRWGRRRMLLVSVVGFTIATGLTSLAWGLAAFVGFQLLSRVFLATEETLSGVVLTEELRPDRRGGGIALLGIISMTGFGLVAALLLAVDATPLGWRLFYVVALLPLAVVLYLRRNLRETRAFDVAAAGDRIQPSWIPHVPGELRGRLARVTLLVGVVGMLSTAAFFYAAELAQDTYGWDGLFTVVVIAAGPATLAGYSLGGRLSDRVGRRPVSVVAILVFSAGAVVLFTESRVLFAPGFFLLAGADAAFQACRTAYVSELFPTEVRATLSSFVSAVGVAAGSLGLVVVGVLSDAVDTSATVVALAVVCAAAATLVRRLPETSGTDVTR